MADGINQYKVRLSAGGAFASIDEIRRQTVVFDATPELVENRNINYKSFDPVHAPGQIFVYQNTSSRTFQLSSVKLLSRTPQEASENLARLWTLRGWTMPNFGKGIPVNGQNAANDAADSDAGALSVKEMIRQMSEGTSNRGDFLGAPPAVLRLSAYAGQGIGHVRNVPVVITQLSIPYPADGDYIPTAEKHPTPMPTIMTIDIQLTEAQTPNAYERFNLNQFKTGDLSGF